ncbi:bifunctional oligoribonuclease/PAP phosphatase NrnA [Desulfovibrio aminophilus]|nr:bifunctional oligoribonuclease/PAP phosphatase NrnA [Desulfovibrio aminophilus]MCM0755220.1 bifunctional oligoribonuclease/PAP phosphatase NrnA [Desulfovibrio aminophilus]
MPSPIREISEILKNSRSFLVASHVNPDGDAIGAMAALGFLLRSLDKDVVLYNPSGLPERYAWIALPGPIATRLPDAMPDWTVTLDCGAAERLGSELHARLIRGRTVNIDHHLGNPGFGAVNWVDPAEPAVGAMVAKLARELGLPLTGDLAEAVYLAVVTDTGHFTYGNTTPEVLELTAELLRGGLDLESLNARINNQWSPRRLELWRRVLGSLELRRGGRLALAVVTREDMDSTGTSSEDCEEFVNFLRRLRGARVCVLVRQEGADRWKMSLRSQGEDDVRAVAALFGGGGHRNAAGALTEAPLDAVLVRLDEAVGRMPGMGGAA